MFTLESNVDVGKIKAGRGNPVVMSLDLNPQISFTMENANINKDMFSALCYNLSQVGTTAAEAGQALRKTAQALYKQNQTWSYTTAELEQLADKLAEMGCTSFKIQSDEVEDIMTMPQNSRDVNLLRPETSNATETPNQNESFDFLEQNAYDEENSGWITPLDTI